MRDEILDPGGPAPPGLVVGEVLGRGASSVVRRAVETATGRAVALKLLPLTGHDRAGTAARFAREFAITRELAGPHVVEVIDAGELPGAPARWWMTMELLAGGSSAALAPRGAAEPDLAHVLPVLDQVAGALDAAHRADVVHRDVKPANVLLRTPPGEAPVDAVLTDFGTARVLGEAQPLTPHGRVAGSLPYAAPEVLTAARVTPATDVYSLACSAVEWLTGEPPYPRSTPFAIVHAHLTADPPRLSARRPWLPPALDDVLARGLAVRPADRYPGCGELAAAVTAALADCTAPVPASSVPSPGRSPWWRRLGR